MNFFRSYGNYHGKEKQRLLSWLIGLDPAIKRMIIMRINFVVFLLAVTIMNVCAAAHAQTVTLSLTNASLEKALQEISKQTGYAPIYNDKHLVKSHPVSIHVKATDFKEVLDRCFEGQPVSYDIIDKTIVVKLKPESVRDKIMGFLKKLTVTGKVLDEKGIPLVGVTIKVKGTTKAAFTDKDGKFTIEVADENAVLQFSFVGYQSQELDAKNNANPTIILKESINQLEEFSVVNTGYQSLPKERATGSFVQIDNELLNRRVGTNILDRIDGISTGLYRGTFASLSPIATNPITRNTGIIIRGKSTFNASTEPLIVVDNFPYEGEISNINPNDIQSVTILKDAAAASIWGARSGNGVIVITTKKGQKNQKMKIDFNSNITIINKPDLFSSRNYLDSKSYMEVEQYLYDKGFFDAMINDNTSFPTVSPGVELMVKLKNANNPADKTAIQAQLDLLANTDVRNDYNKYVYQKAINQQYSLGLRGGSPNMTYQFSVGHDNNRSNLVRNGFSRTTVNLLNTYSPLKNLEFMAGINYSQNKTDLNNDFGFGSYTGTGYPYGNIYPYARLADQNGNALPVIRGLRDSYTASAVAKGFLDWQYRPLDEIAMADNSTKVSDILIRFGVKYQFLPQLSAEVNYQNERQMIRQRNYHSQSTYYTRNLINQFSVPSTSTGMVYNFPLGGILDLGNYDWYVNNIRGQLNYNQTFKQHSITAIAGVEIRQFKTEGSIRNSYGYEEQFGTAVNNLDYAHYLPINPIGSALIPSPDALVTGTLNRYLSYYANAGYTLSDKYILNLSARADGTNLFGAKTNDRITPLWSAGLGWNIGKEAFYDVTWLPYLKLRATYGFNGNTYQNGSAYLIGYYFNDSSTGAKTITNTSAPNPRLRWEKVRNINLGLDFATKGNVISGTIELFQKNGNDLIQPTILAPQTGFTTYTANTAKTKTQGIDLTLQSENLKGAFKWNTSLLLTALHDKVLKYDAVRNASSIYDPGKVVGKPLSALFTYKWAGLDPATGDPQGYLNGKISKDYLAIINNYNPDSLVYKGSLLPTVYGAFRNDFQYQNFSLSLNIVYQLGFVFQRTSTSINYTDILQYGQNQDYTSRWQHPGDEAHTSVPSLSYPTNSSRNSFYQNSEARVENGNNIRLQDVKLAYDLPEQIYRKLKASKVSLYLYANNLGIIWRKNKLGLDPTAAGNGLAIYPNPFSMSFGLNANF
ncbi:MAG: SusC/RagA family TonB-linked outer membrane protein [Candidatus Pedobacter colombiensis]|uniref:SusC/RagA family TonB-linked outer membrane protein n=1 Tax=Candidatus Pedobacter colombiensis TaxID=3121371 RepID=A0AAJ5W4P3_9SPHI|nr:SusC/RagA family TonB-linked outer membrane protein [Pedobacter sp.]WEK17917.1 MAG: SusC/RagA family TonB-linked outer membrane protein [Pedobacter sp.]